ncbi:hypothetical protein E2C01_050428 [Portunus trituberculatus]|uniref:Uncharacterized protein n=1 Tax=Portunus trituberculatus TaxID=210409 RepID=A0A5B7GGR4_PORTR|nr:hypothetical protein [Portunus trituberculatus]
MSLLWSTNKAVANVMAVACWGTQSVFATHFLKAVHRVQDGIIFVGPIMAAGSVIPLSLLLCATPSYTATQFEGHSTDLLGDTMTALPSVFPCMTSTHAW